MRSEMTLHADLTLREIDLSIDADAVLGLDTSYRTDHMFDVESTNNAMTLSLRPLPAPRLQRYAIDLDVPAWTEGFAAIRGGVLCGFIATDYQSWNRRLTIWHFYVDARHRRCGIGRSLMDHALGSGRRHGAERAWVETSNYNYPAVQAYQRLGFTICGFDMTLYGGTSHKDEFAVYLAAPVRS